MQALKKTEYLVELDRDLCISCLKCVDACPFGAIYAHDQVDNPIKCDLYGGSPQCVAKCPKKALRLIPEQVLGESKRLNKVLSYAHMKEIEKQDFERLLDLYYQKRGWDARDIPAAVLVKRFSL